ncbi:unnamed protein product [Mytilus edulis]|uniref:Uncharacterized protein n=1 Tax=Mytilus edulis TaxID=6550 RepID=A0A8S3T7X9_MYTED|nr:unnamed protein product [Mytilus edulis]
MGTKNRSDVATKGRIMKHITPSEDEEKLRLNNYDMVPKLPTVKITQKPQQGPNLSDFLDKQTSTVENKNGGIKLKPVGKEKAFAILKQYNSIVSNEVNLTVKNLPSVKLPFKKQPHQPPLLPKPDVTPRKVPIFTEGISSLSKTSKPSFLIPKDKVLRANLPNNVVVAHKKDNYSFGVKLPKRKSPNHIEDSTKFKQMHNLGLDSLPIVNLEKFMKTKKDAVDVARGLKPIPNGNRKTKPRRLDPIASDSNLKPSIESSRSYDWTSDRKKANRWKDQNSAKSEGKANVVWIGKSLNFGSSSNRTRILKQMYPQEEANFRTKQGDELNRMKFQNRDPSVLGVCSLAPIDVIGQSTKLFTDIPFREKYKGFPKHHTRSNVRDYYFETDSESSLNDDWKNMINNAITNRSSSAESGTVTPRAVPNPPPSYVSSTHEDEEALIPLEISKTMHRIQEERSSLMMDSASNRVQQTFSAGSRQLQTRMSPAPVITINNATLEDEEPPKQISSTTPRKSKEPMVSSVVELKLDHKHLNVPKFMDSERRPPVKLDGESNSQSQSHSSSDPVKSKTVSSVSDNQKLNITTLQLITTNERNSPLPPFNSFLSDAETAGFTPRNTYTNVKLDGGNDETFKHLTINNKTLQFISPLQVQSNAKRQ